MNEFLGEYRREQKIKTHKSFHEDYDHRKKTISFKIAFIAASELHDFSLISYSQYFETKKSTTRHRQISTKIL